MVIDGTAEVISAAEVNVRAEAESSSRVDPNPPSVDNSAADAAVIEISDAEEAIDYTSLSTADLEKLAMKGDADAAAELQRRAAREALLSAEPKVDITA